MTATTPEGHCNMDHTNLRLLLVGVSLSALLGSGVAVAEPASQSDGLARMGQQLVGELTKPELGVSFCLLSPIFASDNMTVAASFDRVFATGDVFIAVGADPVDPTAKRPVGELLRRHVPGEDIPIKIRRTGAELVVTAKCTDTKPVADALLKAAYAASKNDPVECVDGMSEARRLHALSAAAMNIAYFCAVAARRIVGNPEQARGLYEIHRELILENVWSLDALGRIRGTILSAVDRFRKHNNALLGDDLMQMYDQAVAAKSPTTAMSTR